jgi:hypothetical protein
MKQYQISRILIITEVYVIHCLMQICKCIYFLQHAVKFNKNILTFHGTYLVWVQQHGSAQPTKWCLYAARSGFFEQQTNSVAYSLQANYAD